MTSMYPFWQYPIKTCKVIATGWSALWLPGLFVFLTDLLVELFEIAGSSFEPYGFAFSIMSFLTLIPATYFATKLMNAALSVSLFGAEATQRRFTFAWVDLDWQLLFLSFGMAIVAVVPALGIALLLETFYSPATSPAVVLVLTIVCYFFVLAFPAASQGHKYTLEQARALRQGKAGHLVLALLTTAFVLYGPLELIDLVVERASSGTDTLSINLTRVLLMMYEGLAGLWTVTVYWVVGGLLFTSYGGGPSAVETSESDHIETTKDSALSASD